MYAAASEIDLEDGSPLYLQPDTKLFRSFRSLRNVAITHQTAFKKCFGEVSASFGSLGATRWFGNFADARLLYDGMSSVLAGTLAPVDTEAAERWRPALQQHMEQVFNPTLALVERWSEEIGIASDTLYASQIWPSVTIGNAASLLERAKKYPFQCIGRHSPYDGSRRYLCSSLSSTSSAEVAMESMRTPVAESLIDIADWILVLAQVADIYDQSSEDFARDMFEIDGQMHGKRMMENVIDLLNLGVAHYNLVYGFPAVEAVRSAIARTDETSKTALSALRDNQYLAHNFAVSVLNERLDEHAELHGARMGTATTYTSALKALLDDGVDFPLRNLFGPDAEFLVENDRPIMRIPVAADLPEPVVPLPMPAALAEGRIAFPPGYQSLLSKRDHLVDRLASYELTSELDDTKMEDFVRVFLSGQNAGQGNRAASLKRTATSGSIPGRPLSEK